MNARKSNSTSKTTADATSAVDKMEKLAKIASDRTAFDHYQATLSGIWFNLALDEFICRTLYALTCEVLIW